MYAQQHLEALRALVDMIDPPPFRGAQDAMRRHISGLEQILAEIYRVTGADPDGNEPRHLAPYALAEVRRLRADCDEADEENVRLWDVARAAREWCGGDDKMLPRRVASALANLEATHE